MVYGRRRDRLHGTVLLVPGASHYLQVEKADQVNPAIASFLVEHQGS